jgi:hypothetical protein
MLPAQLRPSKDKICPLKITSAGKSFSNFLLLFQWIQRLIFYLIETHLPETIIGIFQKKLRGLIMEGWVAQG